ncbi:MAG: glycosyltransferase [Rhodospirillaceae bacterium]|nr:glycosyltransferase [Rhodospirillaceae bacterium]
MTPAQRHLVVMAKAPRMGRVKTRLAADIGTLAAWNFYRRTLARVVRPLARDPRWTLWLAVNPDATVTDDQLWPVRSRRITQGDGDLGRRMARVMAVMPTGPVVIIGADIPGIRPCHIWQAFKAMGRHDAVFGPAADGGYWLVGQRRTPRMADIFQNVRWSSADALADTRANLPTGWRAHTLGILTDVDDGPTCAAMGRQDT